MLGHQRKHQQSKKAGPQNGRKCVQILSLIRNWSSKYWRSFHNSTTTMKIKQQNFKNGRRTWTDLSPKKIQQWPRGTRKDAPHHHDTALHTRRMTGIRKQRVLAKLQRTWKPCTLLVGLWMGTAIVKSLAVPWKCKLRSTLWPSNYTFSGPESRNSKRECVRPCPRQHYSQHLRCGTNPSVHPGMNR